jgi:hypothetical protein
MADFLTEKQQEDLQYFYNKRGELLENPIYKHKFVLIHSKNIAGMFDTFENAITNAVSKFQPGEFIIQQIIPDAEISGFIYSAFAPA